jgi:hypothetical protein
MRNEKGRKNGGKTFVFNRTVLTAGYYPKKCYDSLLLAVFW